MICVVDNFLECRLRASQHVLTVLSNKVCGEHTNERVVNGQLIRPEQPDSKKKKMQKIRSHSGTH